MDGLQRRIYLAYTFVPLTIKPFFKSIRKFVSIDYDGKSIQIKKIFSNFLIVYILPMYFSFSGETTPVTPGWPEIESIENVDKKQIQLISTA